jgi:DNA-binding Lrp family transcriptional regulator
MVELDETDVQILKVLVEDGRISYRRIADKIKVSVPTVSSKIASLESTGVIKRYTAMLDPERLGETSVMVMVKARPSDLREVATSLANDEHVRGAYLLSNCTLLLSCTFTEPAQMRRLVNRLSEVREVTDYDMGKVVETMRDEPRAMVRSGLTSILECAYCREPFRGEGVKVRLDSKDYHVCCPVCAKALQDKYGRLKGGS